MSKETVDVVIVGAGLSGIGAAAQLGMKCPHKTYLILEARDDVGGTWDLFRYPGIRSDSDMYTLGFSFKPWRNPKAIADGPAIKKYIRETADEYGITPQVRFRHRVLSARWSSERRRWALTVQASAGERIEIESQFLFMGSGYYSYTEAYDPPFEGREAFTGPIIHPQFWPDDLDYSNKRIVVIGSGATAVTLVPELSKKAAQVTMLQRSPTYIVARPGKDILANVLSAILPGDLAYSIIRWKNIWVGRFLNGQAKKKPAKTAKTLLRRAQKRLPEGYDMRHFTPSYNPWDQRICLAPDGDFFAAIKKGKASIETDHMERFTETGILLTSGRILEADIIVTATGLTMQTGGEVDIQVDGEPIRFGDIFSYKGVMFSEVPNLVLVFGYTMASWTLKADLAAIYFCRLLNLMDEQEAEVAVARAPKDMEPLPFLDFSSGYVQRAIAQLPKQGDREPWLVHQDYLADRKTLLREAVDDGVIELRKRPELRQATGKSVVENLAVQ